MKASIVALAAVLLLPFCASAENSTRSDGYTIHHNALTTDLLAPEVAAAYGIQRSVNRGMVNISIIKERPGEVGKPVAGKVELNTRNLVGQKRLIPLREVHEGEAIYYIGDFPVVDREHLIFNVQVKLPDEPYPLNARFEQEFFTN